MTIGTISIIVGVVLLILLKLFSQDDERVDQANESEKNQLDLFKEEPEFDRTWSFLPSNIFNRADDD